MPKPRRKQKLQKRIRAKSTPLHDYSKQELIKILKSRGVTQFQKGLTKSDLIYNIQYVHRQGDVAYSHSKGSRRADILVLRNVKGNASEVYKKVAAHGYQAEIQNMITKFHPVKGAGYKAPKMVIPIITGKTSSDEKKIFSEASPHDFVVNYDNTFKLLLNFIQKSPNLKVEGSDVQFHSIVGVALKFIY